MGHQPTINCPFYEKDGMCDHHASRHKVLFGVRQRGEFRRRTGAQDCPSAGCGENLAIDGV